MTSALNESSSRATNHLSSQNSIGSINQQVRAKLPSQNSQLLPQDYIRLSQNVTQRANLKDRDIKKPTLNYSNNIVTQS